MSMLERRTDSSMRRPIASPTGGFNTGTRAAERTWRFAAGCLSSRDDSGSRSTAPLDLASDVAQGLADLLPILLCGEASAELTFEAAFEQFPEHPDPALRAALQKTSADEHRHAVWLRALRSRLPPPASPEPARRAASFLTSLYSNDLGRHLCRVAALDAAVCVVLATTCARHTPLARCAPVRDTFVRIRRDEGRHVRLSRHCIASLNIAAGIEASERQGALSGFARLLGAHAGSFAAIGVDLPAMLDRFNPLEAGRHEAIGWDRG